MSFRIGSISAWTQIDDNDEEGICAFLDQDQQTWIPMIAADHTRIVNLRPWAEVIASATGRPVALRVFVDNGAIVDRIDPPRGQP